MQYIAVCAVLVAVGHLLLYGLAERSSPYLLWLGISGFGMAGLDCIFRYCTPAMTLSAGRLIWYPALLWPKREIAYASVKSWRVKGRKLCFVTHHGNRQQCDLFERSVSDRADLCERLTEGLGSPENSIV
jgi:hypothetical protein